MKDRFIVINDSISGHCCFEYTVVDTRGIQDDDTPGKTMCETFGKDEANLICDALNNAAKKEHNARKAGIIEGIINTSLAIAKSMTNQHGHCTYEHPPFDPDKCEKYRKGGCNGCIHKKDDNEAGKEE